MKFPSIIFPSQIFDLQLSLEPGLSHRSHPATCAPRGIRVGANRSIDRSIATTTPPIYVRGAQPAPMGEKWPGTLFLGKDCLISSKLLCQLSWNFAHILLSIWRQGLTFHSPATQVCTWCNAIKKIWLVISMTKKWIFIFFSFKRIYVFWTLLWCIWFVLIIFGSLMAAKTARRFCISRKWPF